MEHWSQQVIYKDGEDGEKEVKEVVWGKEPLAKYTNKTSEKAYDIPNGVKIDGKEQEDTYPINMIPVRTWTFVLSEEYRSLSIVKFKNRKDKISVSFNYYPRKIETGKPASISSEPLVYTYVVENIDRFEKSAFAGKDNIESVLLPLTIESIGESAFEGCASLEYFSVPSSVKRLGVSVCKGDTALKKVEFNAPLLTLPAYSFSNCSSLSDVVMSDTVTTIGQAAFSGCTSLKDISYFDHTNRFERIAFYKSGLEEIDINENITAIYDYTFADCANLTGVMIPGTVTYIDPTAFLNDSKLTLKVYYDSYAHHFAQDNGIAYQLISDHEMGDVDRSGSVNVTDVTVLQRYLAEWESFDEEQMILADMTGDDGVDISDATAIQFYIVNH